MARNVFGLRAIVPAHATMLAIPSPPLNEHTAVMLVVVAALVVWKRRSAVSLRAAFGRALAKRLGPLQAVLDVPDHLVQVIFVPQGHPIDAVVS